MLHVTEPSTEVGGFVFQRREDYDLDRSSRERQLFPLGIIQTQDAGYVENLAENTDANGIGVPSDDRRGKFIIVLAL